MKAYVVTAMVAAIGIVSTHTEGDHSGDEKCYGVAKSGKNDPNEWMRVEKGKCTEMGRSMTAPTS